jgi:hypothetical protein
MERQENTKPQSKAREVRRLRARGTDVSFAISSEEVPGANDVDQAIERGIRMLELEASLRLEEVFYSGR